MFLQNGKFGQLGEIETSRCKCVSTVGNEEEEARQGKARQGQGRVRQAATQVVK